MKRKQKDMIDQIHWDNPEQLTLPELHVVMTLPLIGSDYYQEPNIIRPLIESRRISGRRNLQAVAVAGASPKEKRVWQSTLYQDSPGEKGRYFTNKAEHLRFISTLVPEDEYMKALVNNDMKHRRLDEAEVKRRAESLTLALARINQFKRYEDGRLSNRELGQVVGELDPLNRQLLEMRVMYMQDKRSPMPKGVWIHQERGKTEYSLWDKLAEDIVTTIPRRTVRPLLNLIAEYEQKRDEKTANRLAEKFQPSLQQHLVTDVWGMLRVYPNLKALRTDQNQFMKNISEEFPEAKNELSYGKHNEDYYKRTGNWSGSYDAHHIIVKGKHPDFVEIQFTDAGNYLRSMYGGEERHSLRQNHKTWKLIKEALDGSRDGEWNASDYKLRDWIVGQFQSNMS